MKRILFLILLTSSLGFAQRNGFYGPETTKFFTESDVINGVDTLRTLDTTLTGFQKYEPGFIGVNSYQDLGVFGTAARPLFTQPDWSTGQQLGYHNYDFYSNEDDVNFYRSYSPYTDLTLLQNGNRILQIDATFSKNITPQLNIGFKLHRFTVVDQIGVIAQNAIWMDHYDGQLFASFENKKGNYKALASYSYLRHIGYEVGGVSLDSGDVAIDSILGDFEVRALTNVETHDRRNYWRFLQTYKVIGDSGKAEGVYAYHLSTRKKKKVFNIDNDFTKHNDIYGFSSLIDAGNVHDSIVFREYSNEVGVRFQSGQQMLRGYVKHRAYTFGQSDSVFQSGEQHEIHLGGVYRFDFTDDLQFNAVADVYQKGVLTRANLKSSYGFVELGASDQPQEYAMQQLAYNVRLSSLVDTNGEAITTDSLSYGSQNNQGVFFFAARAEWPKGKFRPYVGLKNATYSNRRYYDLGDTVGGLNGVSPTIKEATTVSVQTVEVGYKLALGEFKFLGNLAFNKVSDLEVIPLPDLLVDQSIYFEHYIENSLVLYQIGFDIGYRSGYYAPAYQPLFQGFFNQKSNEVQSYAKVDFFANFQIRSQFMAGFRVFHLNDGFGPGGYQASPLYLGQKRAFEILINWKFYN